MPLFSAASIRMLTVLRTSINPKQQNTIPTTLVLGHNNTMNEVPENETAKIASTETMQSFQVAQLRNDDSHGSQHGAVADVTGPAPGSVQRANTFPQWVPAVGCHYCFSREEFKHEIHKSFCAKVSIGPGFTEESFVHSKDE